MKQLFTLLLIGVFGVAISGGCRASGEVGDNDDTSTRTTSSSDGSYSKKTTETRTPSGDYSRTETRTNSNP